MKVRYSLCQKTALLLNKHELNSWNQCFRNPRHSQVCYMGFSDSPFSESGCLLLDLLL